MHWIQFNSIFSIAYSLTISKELVGAVIVAHWSASSDGYVQKTLYCLIANHIWIKSQANTVFASKRKWKKWKIAEWKRRIRTYLPFHGFHTIRSANWMNVSVLWNRDAEKKQIKRQKNRKQFAVEYFHSVRLIHESEVRKTVIKVRKNFFMIKEIEAICQKTINGITHDDHRSPVSILTLKCECKNIAKILKCGPHWRRWWWLIVVNGRCKNHIRHVN